MWNIDIYAGDTHTRTLKFQSFNVIEVNYYKAWQTFLAFGICRTTPVGTMLSLKTDEELIQNHNGQQSELPGEQAV